MKFELVGYDLDNLLKKLYLKKVTLFNVERADINKLSFECSEKDSTKVKRYIKNYKTKKTPPFFKRIPKFLLLNLGVILGVFLGSIFFIFMSAFTFKITIYGTKELSETDIISVLKLNGVRAGKINLQTSEEIEYILLNNYDRIAQVSVIKQGTHIIINVSEKLVYNEENFSPITANFSGIVTKINIISGTNNVRVGDYVNKGDVLVLPFNIDSNGNKVSVKPLAEIQGKMYLTNTLKMSKTETVYKRTGVSQVVYDYQLFNLHLFYGRHKNSFALFDLVSYNENVTSLIPLKRMVLTYFELAPTEIIHDFDLEKQSLIDRTLAATQKMQPENTKKLSEKVTTTIIDDVMYACCTIELEGIING